MGRARLLEHATVVQGRTEVRVSVELGMVLALSGFSAGAFSYVQAHPRPPVDHTQHAHHMVGGGTFKPIAVEQGSPRLHRAALSSLDETRAQIHRLKAQQVGEKSCIEEGGLKTAGQSGTGQVR